MPAGIRFREVDRVVGEWELPVQAGHPHPGPLPEGKRFCWSPGQKNGGVAVGGYLALLDVGQGISGNQRQSRKGVAIRAALTHNPRPPVAAFWGERVGGVSVGDHPSLALPVEGEGIGGEGVRCKL